MKNAIVTGGSRGLGEGMVLKLAEMGYNVVVNFVSDRSKEKAESLIAKIEKDYGVSGLAVQADVADYESCKKIVDASIEKFGRKIDVLVNNAGIDNNLSFLKIKPEQYTRLINVNLMSYLHCSHLVLPYMVEANEGCIVNVSSIGGMMGVAEQADYCAAKSGVIGLTRGLAIEFGRNNIRVNTIAPGMIWTDMLREADQAAVAALKQAIPLGDIGEVDDIAGCLEYLVKAKYVTGQTISPNGGILMP
ncbi:SDR family NAD(P)-dependent oxidoreductase [Caproiciproducens sp. LBM24188]|nr:SDR family oxidoreductase [Oscillospiraceae bacterium]HHV32761.1 SDR family oxidoreductase [Clostridiales bacterium]